MIAGGLGVASLGSSAGGASSAAVKEVDANGNAFTGGLAFDPAAVMVPVGGTVRWTNTDFLVPHTATENHMLWQLTGDYGGTPLTPPGFGPGESRERRFAAGTWSYYCEVHPTQMRGTVGVPVRLRLSALPSGRPAVQAVWGVESLPAGQVFDVQERVGSKPWRTVRRGTRALRATFGAAPRQTFGFRALVRSTDDPAARSGYSPVARARIPPPQR